MVCSFGPPSDHLENVYVDRFTTWVSGALTELAEPTITVTVNGVDCVDSLNPSPTAATRPGWS